MSKKNINDADFFDDEHLDSIAEEESPIDPDDGNEPPVDSDEAEPAGKSDDDDGDEDEEAEPETDKPEVTPDPHLPDDPAALAAMYSEVRKFANRTERENQELRRSLEAAQAQANAVIEYDFDDEPAYDTRQFATIASEDPRAAFQYALSSGQTSDAQAAIAQVEVDAAELAAAAALASSQDNQQMYMQYRSQAQNAAALAQSMHGELNQVQRQAELAPHVKAERDRNLAAAEHAFDQATQGDFRARYNEVVQVLSQRPNLLAGTEARQIYEGIEAAYAIVKSRPAPVSTAVSVDEIARNAVEKHLAATRAAKKQAADAASGAAGDRSGPAGGGTEEPSLKDAIYAERTNASLGAKAFMGM